MAKRILCRLYKNGDAWIKAMTLLIMLFFLSLFSNDAAATTLDFYGDILLSRGIEKFVSEKGTDELLKGVEPLLSRNSIKVVNMEGAVGNPASCVKDHTPCFSVKSDIFPALNGFDVIGLANNHSLDLGKKGLEKTLFEIKNRGQIPVGGKDFFTIIRTDKGDIAIVALTDVVNSKDDAKHMIMAYSERALNAIKRLKARTGMVAVYIHWGKELDDYPTERMKELAKKMVDAGADIIVGHHSHVVGRVECINGKPVVYSLGNFIFDQKYEDTKSGAVLQCSIGSDDKLFCQLVPVKTEMNSYSPQLILNSTYNTENASLKSCAPELIQTWSGRFSSDRKDKRLTLRRSKEGITLSKMELFDTENTRPLWKSPSMPIEKLQPVDLDGDGISEVMLIQNIYSSIDEETDKRVYIYSLNGGLKALWRGSALSRPLLDAIFITDPINRKPLLIGLHTSDSFLVRDKNREGRIVMSYRWDGFGFSGVREKLITGYANRILSNRGKLVLNDSNGEKIQELSIEDLR